MIYIFIYRFILDAYVYEYTLFCDIDFVDLINIMTKNTNKIAQKNREMAQNEQL